MQFLEAVKCTLEKVLKQINRIDRCKSLSSDHFFPCTENKVKKVYSHHTTISLQSGGRPPVSVTKTYHIYV